MNRIGRYLERAEVSASGLENLGPNEDKRGYENLINLVYLVEGGPNKKTGRSRFRITEGPYCGRLRGYRAGRDKSPVESSMLVTVMEVL